MAIRGTVKTTSVDHGEKALRLRIAELAKSPEGSHVDVGILEQSGEHKGGQGVSVVDVAVWAEFGTRTEPERAFMRTAAAELMPIMTELGAKMLEAYLTGKVTLDQALDRLGLKAQSVIKLTIRDFKDPPNAVSTILAKARKEGRAKIKDANAKGQGLEALDAYNNPLVDTGQLMNSVQYVKVKA